MNCPKCQSTQIIKYGHTHYGKPRFRCQDCRRQFVEHATRQPIEEATRQLINKLLLERLARFGNRTSHRSFWALATNVCKSEVLPGSQNYWYYSNKTGRLTIQLDELWSFFGSKDNKQWVWLALDADSREIIGVKVGDRSRQSAKQLWQSLPTVYRQCAVCYTDFWEAMNRCYPASDIEPLARKRGKPVMLSDLTTRYASE